MADLNIRIKTLPEMWVAAVYAAGTSPEAEAWRRLREWAGPKGLLDDPVRYPIFGFNNPNPSESSSEYGYELWIRVEEPGPRDGAVAFKQFVGGLFAVATCQLHGDPDIMKTWRRLWEWAQTGEYRWRRAQELERVLNPGDSEADLVLELYLPVEEQLVTPEARSAIVSKI